MVGMVVVEMLMVNVGKYTIVPWESVMGSFPVVFGIPSVGFIFGSYFWPKQKKNGWKIRQRPGKGLSSSYCNHI